MLLRRFRLDRQRDCIQRLCGYQCCCCGFQWVHVYLIQPDCLLTCADHSIVVPVLRNVENLTIPALEKSLHSLQLDAESGSLAVEDLAGGTFTILNAGIHDALLSTSMLTSPQSAALSIHSIRHRPVVINGEIVPRPMMFLSLTYDHRIIDGREAVTFLKMISDGIGDPRRLLIEI